MPKLNWNGNDFRNNQDSSGTVADNISRNGNLQQGYNHGSLTRGLVAYYPMEKGEGEVLHDGAFDNLGQISGDFSWLQDSNLGTGSLEFDGQTGCLKSNFSPPAGGSNNQFCKTFWFKTTDSGSKFLASHNDSGWRYYSEINSSGELIFNLYDNSFSSSERIVNSGTAVNDGNWHHAIINLSSGQMELYIDGQIKDTVDCTGDSDYGSLYLGGMPDSTRKGPSFLQIRFESIRFFNRSLSEQEIQALYNEGNGVQSGEKKGEKCSRPK